MEFLSLKRVTIDDGILILYSEQLNVHGKQTFQTSIHVYAVLTYIYYDTDTYKSSTCHVFSYVDYLNGTMYIAYNIHNRSVVLNHFHMNYM